MALNVILPQDIYAFYLESIGKIKFTRREIDTIAYLLSGKSAKTIAHCLSISPKTIETHMRNIMIKLECNSRDGIVNFIEQSKKLSLLKEYYLSLLAQASFEEKLLNIAAQIGPEPPSCAIVYWKDQNYFSSFIDSLKSHLKQVGVKTLLEAREGEPFIKDPVATNSWKIYVVPEIMTKQNGEFLQKIQEIPKNIIALIPNRNTQNNDFDTFKVDNVHHLAQENYYDFIFMVLKKLLPHMGLDQIIVDFKNHCEVGDGTSKILDQSLSQRNQIWENIRFASYLAHIYNFFGTLRKKESNIFIGSVCALCIGFIALIGNRNGVFTQNQEWKGNLITRADLNIPTQTVFLDRPQLMKSIDKSLKESRGIQTIALVGIGGAGKTTLARHYARQQNANVVWEFNAESRESLHSSFEGLAEALSTTEEEKKRLRELRDIKDAKEREKKIVSLARDKLQKVQNWMLIYDNVTKFADIQNHFPHDPHVWGQGKIILITRDNNIENNNNVHKTIPISELSSEEKLALFTKIMANENSSKFTFSQIEHAKRFLNDIPPFPLDVSIAAYYLKTTKIPYEKYLEHLQEHNKDFTAVQENVLKEATHYTKTRYGIITLSLKNLIGEHEDFAVLLLLISLLDNQSIPRDLLDAYKNEVLVENFIYNLKKYSFITHETLPSLQSLPTFSIHRSTQEISLEYLITALRLQKSQSLQEIFNNLEVYVAEAIDKEDLLKMKLLLSHCERLLSHKDLLTDTVKRSIGGELGYIYFYLGNYKKSREIIEESLQGLTKGAARNHDRIAHILAHIGDVYREFGEYEKAKTLLEQSLTIYKEQSNKDHMGIAQASVYLGNVYRRLGNYEKSKSLLEESLVIYRQHSDTNYPATARALATLANIYRSLAQYKKAKELFNESLAIYKKHFPENHPRIAWTLAHLGNVYKELGHYKQAKDLIERSLMLYKQHFSENHAKVGWVLSLSGDIYKKLGDFEKAKDLFEQASIVFKNHFPENDSKIAHNLMDLGEIYGNLGDYKRAKNLLIQSLTIYKKHFPEKHDEIVVASTYLANIYVKLGNYEPALALLEESLKTLQIHFRGDYRKILLPSLHLGNTYKHLGRYKEAKKTLESCLQSCEEIYGKDHIETARVLRVLGEVFFLEGQKEVGNNFMNKAVLIFQKNEHPEANRARESLKTQLKNFK